MPGKKQPTNEGTRATKGEATAVGSTPGTRDPAGSVRVADQPVTTRLVPIGRFPPPDDPAPKTDAAPEARVQLVFRKMERHPPPEEEPKARTPRPDTRLVLRPWSPRRKDAPVQGIGSMDPSRRKK